MGQYFENKPPTWGVISGLHEKFEEEVAGYTHRVVSGERALHQLWESPRKHVQGTSPFYTAHLLHELLLTKMYTFDILVHSQTGL